MDRQPKKGDLIVTKDRTLRITAIGPGYFADGHGSQFPVVCAMGLRSGQPNPDDYYEYDLRTMKYLGADTWHFPEYPEHERLAAVKPQSQAQGELLEWLGANGYTICDHDVEDGQFYPIHTPIEELLAKVHGIDLVKIEREKRRMLEKM